MADTTRTSYSWSNGLMLVLAIWLFVSPWILTAPAMGAWAWNAWVVAVIMGALAIAALAQIAQWEDWVTLALGAWLFFSPWIYGYAMMQAAAWNSYIVGVLAAVISIWGIAAARQASVGATVQSQ